jgi:chaperonin GroES
MNNTSGINPTGHMLVIKVEKAEEKTAGGIIIPDKVRDRDDLASTKGTLVAAGPCAGDYADWPEGSSFVPVGSRVMIRKFAGVEAKGNDGMDYRVCEDKDILAALEG